MNEILTTLTGTTVHDPSSIIEQGFLGNSPLTANCLIKAFEIHSICDGTVLTVEMDPKYNTWCITVEVNSQNWIRYWGLADFKVTYGQKITRGTFLGYAHKYKMRLEYCNNVKSQFPVRVSNRQLYKNDPTPIIFGQINLSEVI